MRKNILIVLVMNLVLGFNFTISLAQTTDELQTQNEIKEKAVRFHSNLSLLSISERKALFGGLTPELKSEIWKVQLRSYLSKHPDLTDKQRKAIEFAIVFIKPQVYEIPQHNPEFEEKVNKPMLLLEKKMLEVFSQEVVRELLNVLGGSQSAVSLNVQRIKFVSGLGKSGCASTTQQTNSWLPKNKIQAQQPFKQTSVSLVFDQCACSTRSSGDCFVKDTCLSDGCSQQNWCGRAWAYVCDGDCYIMMDENA